MTNIYIAWNAIFNPNSRIIMCFNTYTLAKLTMHSFRQQIQPLLVKMGMSLVVSNNECIKLENGTKIFISNCDSEILRGAVPSLVCVDDASYIPDKKFDEFLNSFIPTMLHGCQSQLIMNSSPFLGKSLYEKMFNNILIDENSQFIPFVVKSYKSFNEIHYQNGRL